MLEFKLRFFCSMACVLKSLRHITSASPETLRIDLIIVVVGDGNWGRGRRWAWLPPTVEGPFLTQQQHICCVHLHRAQERVFHTVLHCFGRLFGIDQAASPFVCGPS